MEKEQFAALQTHIKNNSGHLKQDGFVCLGYGTRPSLRDAFGINYYDIYSFLRGEMDRGWTGSLDDILYYISSEFYENLIKEFNPKTKLEILEEEKNLKEAELADLVSKEKELTKNTKELYRQAEQLQKDINRIDRQKQEYRKSARNIRSRLFVINDEITTEEEKNKLIEVCAALPGWYELVKAPEEVMIGMKFLVANGIIYVNPEGSTALMKSHNGMGLRSWRNYWAREIK